MMQATTLPHLSGLNPKGEGIKQPEQPSASSAASGAVAVAFIPRRAGDIEYTADDDYEAIESFVRNAGR